MTVVDLHMVSGWVPDQHHLEEVGGTMCEIISHGPLARYMKLRVAHASGVLGTFSPPPRVSDLDMQHGTCVTHVPWCMPGSLTIGFLWSHWRGKRSRQSRRMRNPKYYVSGKRPMDYALGFVVVCFVVVALCIQICSKQCIENRESSWCQLCGHWWHHMLS